MTMVERRRYPRTRVTAHARIILEDSSILDCTVCDLTVAGAGIVAAPTTDMSVRFDLTFDDARSLRPCRLIWRARDRFGVEFLQAG
jgi:PilZ domain